MKNLKYIIAVAVLILAGGFLSAQFPETDETASLSAQLLPEAARSVVASGSSREDDSYRSTAVSAGRDTTGKTADGVSAHPTTSGDGPAIAAPDLQNVSRTKGNATQPESAPPEPRSPLVGPATLSDPAYNILLQAGTIDTRSGPVLVADSLRFDPADIPASQPIRYLVQFAGPILPDWKRDILALGGTFGDYLPHHAFVVSLTEAQKERVTELPFVQWLDYYHPAYKLSAGLENDQLLAKATRSVSTRRSAQAAADVADTPVAPDSEGTIGDKPQLMDAASVVLLLVQTFDSGRLPYLYQLTDTLPAAAVIDASDERTSRVLIEVAASTLEASLITLAQADEVEWIEPYIPPELNNNEAASVVQSPGADGVPLWDRGLTGSGQVVGVGDTGLDVDMVFFWDESAGLPSATVNLNQRKIISYHDLAGTGDWDGHDHGTHVAGTIAGKSASANSAFNGLAYDAKLVIQDIGSGGNLTGIPVDLNSYFQQAYDDGARIHSNSWGSTDTAGAYTAYAQDADEFMWHHPDFLVVFSAGNSGPTIGSVGSPGTAKNVVTSGAGENAHSGYNIDNVASFSSQGPTIDGRIKPTVVAPGHYLFSADNDGTITSFNSGVQAMSGTSMSAPAHAGSAALIRQYFSDGFYPSGNRSAADSLLPSGALLRAVLINSATAMNGAYTGGSVPSTGQGWGRIVLDNTLFFSGDDHSLFIDDQTAGLSTSETRTYTFSGQGDQPVKVTLAWTDYPASLSAGVQLVNDLDLIVTTPTGSYRGNVFTNGISSSGGDADRRNVEEVVWLPAPGHGLYTISVTAHTVPIGPQPFALVVTGLIEGSSAGAVSFDKELYRPGAEAVITVNDIDLDESDYRDSALVHLHSGSDAGINITLTETTEHSGVFQATVTLDDALLIDSADTITASYADGDNGSGSPTIVEATAMIDRIDPALFSLSMNDSTERSIRIDWQTSEPSSGRLFYRPENDTTWQELASASGTEHTVTITDLQPSSRYEMKIEMLDDAGNIAVFDNNGSFYRFRTADRLVLLEDSMENGSSLFAVSDGSNQAGENGLWHLSTYRASDGATAWYYGLEESKTYDTGLHNWGTITSQEVIDLSGIDAARLTFRHILETENDGGFDIARVQVSTDNVTFNTVFQSVGSTTDWEEIAIDLSPYLGSAISVRFTFDTVDVLFNAYEGWLVDEIRIIASRETRGDIDGDGSLSLTDLVSVLRIVSGATTDTPSFLQADVDSNGALGLAEALYVLQVLSE
ncbi:S8 family serine peptidase [bacterium]|nr:S8 family serine peptidase [bacterium]